MVPGESFAGCKTFDVVSKPVKSIMCAQERCWLHQRLMQRSEAQSKKNKSKSKNKSESENESESKSKSRTEKKIP